MELLVVIDMQNDFIDGALGTKEAVQILPNVVSMVNDFKGEILFTRDTHTTEYLNTQEGKNLPVVHCIKDSYGWELAKDLKKYAAEHETEIIDKPSFGCMVLPEVIKRRTEGRPLESITLIGLCTDICIISNAMILKAAFPEVPIIVQKDCCAGVTVPSHENAIEAMKMCQIQIR